MAYTAEAILGGYRILKDGVAYIEQPFQPELPGFVPYPDAASALSAAQALIVELEAAQQEA